MCAALVVQSLCKLCNVNVHHAAAMRISLKIAARHGNREMSAPLLLRLSFGHTRLEPARCAGPHIGPRHDCAQLGSLASAGLSRVQRKIRQKCCTRVGCQVNCRIDAEWLKFITAAWYHHW